MNIFGTDIYREKLAYAIQNSREATTLVSAYLTIEGMDWVLCKLTRDVKCRVLSRWNCNELLSGASDIEVYEKLRKYNFSLHILPDLHAKVIVIDNKFLFLGSANITNSGLRLVPGGNKEIGTIITPDEQDLDLIETLFNEAILVTDELYLDFYKELQDLKETNSKPEAKVNWSKNLQNKLLKPPTKLWVAETLWSQSPEKLFDNINSGEVVHDLALLGFDSLNANGISKEILKQAFLQSRIWKWFKNKIFCTENREMYFGELSANLHSSLLDDPTPYRQTVKTLLSNLLEWSSIFGSEFILIDRPNHSQRVRLIK